MKKTNVFKILITSLVSCIFSAFFLSCIPSSEPSTDGNDYFTLNKTQVSIMLGETFVLEADYNTRDNATLAFSSDDNKIVTVNEEGLLTGMSLGSTQVKATYGEDEVVCKVTVESQGVVPYVDFINEVEDSVKCYVGDGLNLSAQINFNAKTYADGEISYVSSATDVAEITKEGKLNAKTTGKTNVTLNAKWRGFEASKTIEVEVADKVECCINGGEISAFNLGTIPEFRGQTYTVSQPVAVTAKANGADISNCTVNVLNENVCKYEDGSLIAVGAGETIFQVKVPVGEKEYTYDFAVSVSKPHFIYEGKIFLDEKKPFPSLEVFGEADNVISAVDVNEKLTLAVSDGKISGFTVVASAPKSETLVVETSKLSCTIEVTPCTNYIHTLEEMKEIFISGKNFDGYYVLANDIEAYTVEEGNRAPTWKTSGYGLTGTFEGNGHTINNLSSNMNGMFGEISGTVKNVAFTNMHLGSSLHSAYVPFGVIKESSKANLSNVYLGYAEGSWDNSANGSKFTVIGRTTLPTGLVMNNVVIDISKVTLSNPYRINLMAEYSNHFFHLEYDGTEKIEMQDDKETKPNEYKKTYVKNTNKQLNNVYVISKSPLMYHAANTANQCLRILDATNQKNNTSYYDPQHLNWANVQQITFDNIYRYETLSEFATAVQSADVSSFTESGYWKADAVNGLVFK